MARPKSEHGRRVHVNVMLSEAEAALVDSVRGGVARGPWMREAAIEAARRRPGIPEPGKRDSGTPERGGKRDSGIPASRNGAGAAECPPHPKGRVLKGLCGTCGRAVLPGEKVA